MLSKSIAIFVICNYVREILNINVWEVYVNYKISLYIGSDNLIYLCHLRKIVAQ